MIKLGYVPHSFGESYTVPILKGGISSHVSPSLLTIFVE